jgi:hypothetical protein
MFDKNFEVMVRQEARKTGQSPEELKSLVLNLAARQQHNCERQTRRMASVADNFHEALPLNDGSDDYGRVIARIPKTAFFQLIKQKNFGYEGMMSDEGMKDIFKAFPQCRVKTISPRIFSGTGGWSGKRQTVKSYG